MTTYYNSNEAVPNIPGATYQEIKARFRDLAAVADAVGAERKALNDEIRRREKEAAMRGRLGTLKPDDRALYREVLK